MVLSVHYPSLFQVGGSLAADTPCYVRRKADQDLYQALLQGEFCYVFNARQMGKSSLQVQTLTRLRQAGVRCGAIDLTTIGNQQITAEQWYASLLHTLIKAFDLELDLVEWWTSLESLSLTKRLNIFIEQVLLVQVTDPIVIFLDEVDSLLGLEGLSDDFFAWLRTCYNQRAETPAYRRLTFALLGVATPTELIADKQRTPFNIGRAIPLTGFTPAEACPLVQGLQPWFTQPKQILQAILAWTGGQPFLTQKLCQAAVDHASQFSDESALLSLEPATWIAQLVQRRVLESWESQDNPEHLQTIRNRLLHSSVNRIAILGQYREILSGETVEMEGSDEQLALELSGLVVNECGQLQVKNRIYQSIFTLDWVEEQLAALRPYSRELQAWVTSEGRDASCWLQGDRLTEALRWSEDHHLSKLDYRFLQACQHRLQQTVETQLETETSRHRDTQIALKAAQEASQMLARARRDAQTQPIAWGRRRRCLAGITLGVLAGIGTLRSLGLLQPLEWSALDQFVQLRPVAAIDERISLVTLDEPDIQELEQFPISDEQLAQLLNQINRQNPRLMGLGLYRDLPVEPGHEQLNQVLAQTPNLVAIEKFVGPSIAPPPGLSRDQVGMADQLLDGDGTVRRGLLTVLTEADEERQSLALRLALDYLAQEGIEAEPLSSGAVQLGQTVLKPFQTHDGGYVGADDGGYQVLLNYRRDRAQFRQFTVRDVLRGNVPDDAFRDRIVLIGVTAPTVSDLVLTPYSRSLRGPIQQTPAIVVHASIVSQLLDAALHGMPLLRVWPPLLEFLWMGGWTLTGALIGMVSWRGRRLMVALPITMFSLAILCYALYLSGWWVPFIPVLLSVSSGALAMAFLTARQTTQAQLRSTILSLLQRRQSHPAVSQIALEYLKQSETLENQHKICAFVSQSEKIPLQAADGERLQGD